MCVQVYGFGSYFEGTKQCNDIDLLLIHQDTSISSCKFVLRCKTELVALVPKLDISILSRTEAESLSFKEQAEVVAIGNICGTNFESDTRDIATKVLSF